LVTKRQLGWLLILLGLLAIIATLSVDWLGAGKWGGIGPKQALALAASGLILLVGLTLLPLGDRPA
jgi:hypothetical protein